MTSGLASRTTAWRAVALASLLVNLGLLARDAGAPWQVVTSAAGALATTQVDGGAMPALDEADQRNLGEHETNGAMALFFFVNFLVVGAAVLHLTVVHQWLQNSIVLFLLGMLVSFFFEGLDVRSYLGEMGISYDLWMDISPDVLLYSLLPALLAGDAMTIDTSVAKRVSLQCLYLAGPMVLAQALIVAPFFMWLLDWSFILSMTMGAILTATDPVAVVALLKELQASPVLTVQIQGEALLNDGTAMVLYTISYAMLSGEEYDYAGVTKFFVQAALLAWVVGSFTGYLFFQWIRLAGNKFDHGSTMVQILLSICCPYWTFVMCQGLFGMSGVLGTVACSLTLAHNMWPYVVNVDSMHHVWEVLETVGNLVIFFIAGALTGNVMVHIRVYDWVNLLAIYLMLNVLRGVLVFASQPLMKRLAADRLSVSAADAAVMTWGGLRGALGLCLALSVYVGRAGGKVSESEGQRVLFFVSGIAFLTIVLNGVTCPKLVEWMQITAMPKSQQRALSMISQQLVSWSSERQYPPEVVDSLQRMLEEVSGSIGSVKVKAEGEVQLAKRHRSGAVNTPPDNFYEDNNALSERWASLRERHQAMDQKGSRLLGDLMESNPLDVEGVEDMIRTLRLYRLDGFDVNLVKSLNSTFLSMLMAKYKRMMEEGKLRPDSAEADVLITSVRLAQSPLQVDLMDWVSVREFADFSKDGSKGLRNARTAAVSEDPRSMKARVQRLTKSKLFKISIALLILANAATAAVQVLATQGDVYLWGMPLDALFAAAFFAEIVLKLYSFGREYFYSKSNMFHSSLAILMAIALAMDLHVYHFDRSATHFDDADRFSRAVRVLRILFIFRLFHYKLSDDNDASMPLGAPSMRKINALVCFIRAHLESQKDMQKYFGCSKAGDAAGVARVILQSQCEVYDAIQMTVRHEKSTDRTLLSEVILARTRMSIAERFEGFVRTAWKDAAITDKQAEALLDPLHAHMAEIEKEMDQLFEGRTSGRSRSRPAGPSPEMWPSAGAMVIASVPDAVASKRKSVEVEDGIEPTSLQHDGVDVAPVAEGCGAMRQNADVEWPGVPESVGSGGRERRRVWRTLRESESGASSRQNSDMQRGIAQQEPIVV